MAAIFFCPVPRTIDSAEHYSRRNYGQWFACREAAQSADGKLDQVLALVPANRSLNAIFNRGA
jgi:hypothetical protein